MVTFHQKDILIYLLVYYEMVTTETARRVDQAVGAVPTIGIGASNVTTGQVLVWQDAMGTTQIGRASCRERV